MATANRTWGEERIAAELRVKLGICVSPRTIRRYMRRSFPCHRGPRSQGWSIFVRNHAREVLACDFFVTVTAAFRIVYVFVVLDIGTRRIIHWNTTTHPTAEWTVQQFRACITGDQPHRFLIHDHDRIYSKAVDQALTAMGLQILKTPTAAPQANAFRERVIGTVRRECLDFVIPLSERHLRRIVTEWVDHYNHGRPHTSLGPGIPDAPRADIYARGADLPVGHLGIQQPRGSVQRFRRASRRERTPFHGARSRQRLLEWVDFITSRSTALRALRGWARNSGPAVDDRSPARRPLASQRTSCHRKSDVGRLSPLAPARCRRA